jgi:uncharacterized integral membrane protein
MNRLVWIVTIPIAIVVVLFAVNNREAVRLILWPFPWDIEAPIFLFTLGAIVFGFLFGAIAAWGSGGGTRRKLRQAQYDLAHARDEIAVLKRERGKDLPPPPAALPPAA